MVDFEAGLEVFVDLDFVLVVPVAVGPSSGYLLVVAIEPVDLDFVVATVPLAAGVVDPSFERLLVGLDSAEAIALAVPVAVGPNFGYLLVVDLGFVVAIVLPVGVAVVLEQVRDN